jgi:WD40 repeat protein
MYYIMYVSPNVIKLFSNTIFLQYVVKVWNSCWDLLCTFVSHGGCVTSLVPYPYGPMVVSGSSDATIRVWNLATQDQVEV